MSSTRLSFAASDGKATAMDSKPSSPPANSSASGAAQPALTREERLAAKLRENLRRRKAQARQLGSEPGGEDNAPLPKGPPKS